MGSTVEEAEARVAVQLGVGSGGPGCTQRCHSNEDSHSYEHLFVGMTTRSVQRDGNSLEMVHGFLHAAFHAGGDV
jgi:hypothetical protein